MDSERRQAPRYPFIAEAEVTEISSDTKLVATTSDLSISGCFLGMLNPSPQGSHGRSRQNLPRKHHIHGPRQSHIYPPQYGHGSRVQQHRARPPGNPAKMDRIPKPRPIGIRAL